MTSSSPDLSDLYRLLEKEERPILPSGERRAILGCGYVGQAVAQAWKLDGHDVVGTTTRPEKLPDLAKVVNTPIVFNSADPHSSLEFVAAMDGILVSFAPSKRMQVELDQYEQTYLGGLQELIDSTKLKRGDLPTQIVYLSSCGVYGNRGGELTSETDPIDSQHPVNEILSKAERLIGSARSPLIKVCVLRLGGIYGPGRDIPSMLLSAAGNLIQRNGSNVPCWTHLDDIVRGVNFAFDHQLDDTYNLVNDTQFSGQELTDRLCEKAGLPLAKWLTVDTSDRILNAKVCNLKIKRLGFTFKHPCMVS